MKIIHNSLLFVAFSFLLLACGSSSKRLARGSYESAIRKSVRVLQKNPNDLEELNTLKTAFMQSESDLSSQIDQLVAQNNGMALVQAIRLHEQLTRNNDLVRSLPATLAGQFDLKDYTNDIASLTEEASIALHEEADVLMATGIKENQRSAVEKLTNLRSINPQYPEINRMIADAEEIAIYKVFIDISDQTTTRFRDTLVDFLKEDRMSNLNNGKWLQYSLFDSKNIDGEVKVVIHKIGMEKTINESRTTAYDKEVQVPEYVMDANGNVKKDADGNDMKTMKTKNLKAEVIEESVEYDLVLRGNIAFLDHYTSDQLHSEELEQKMTITQSSYQIKGDREAVEVGMLKKIDASMNQDTPNEKNLITKQMSQWKKYVADKIEDSKRKFD